MTDNDLDIANYKYHAATVVALSSGEVAMIGHFTNEEGLPLVSTFATLEDLHAALWEFQTSPWKHKNEPQVQVSLESLGLARPIKRRSLNGA